MRDFLAVLGGLILIVIGSCIGGAQNTAFCEERGSGWVCVGPCGGPGTCPGYGCVCVGASTGVGRCVSE